MLGDIIPEKKGIAAALNMQKATEDASNVLISARLLGADVKTQSRKTEQY